jgi:alkyldihydroxyacetonephosphate synthase
MPPQDASLEQALSGVPPTRLPPSPLVLTDPESRLRHARGQSLPDWVALRSGRLGALPDGVAFPEDDQQVRELLEFARRAAAQVIPYGGGTSVVGHINPLRGSRPVLTLDMSRMARLLELDSISRLATFQAGATGPQIEAALLPHGLTFGHFPQSWEHSTLGGWIATRSSGQQSLRYGRIEDLFAGGHLETPAGPLDLPALPASAAGPDLRQLALGSEGRLGVITQAVVRVMSLPAFERFHAAFLPDWEAGLAAVRELAQAGIDLSMLRLSDPVETETTLALAGRERLVALGGQVLQRLGRGTGRCLTLYGLTGDQKRARIAGRAARAILRRHGGLPLGCLLGELWRRDRFRAPYLRNTLWEAGYALDTLETAVPWSKVSNLAEALRSALRNGLAAEGERVLTLLHLSHLYPDGASLYLTLLFRLAPDPDHTLERWRTLKQTASRLVVSHGGTISHQHGVGLDHREYLLAEKGPAGMQMLRAAVKAVDPHGLMNPGKMVGPGE